MPVEMIMTSIDRDVCRRYRSLEVICRLSVEVICRLMPSVGRDDMPSVRTDGSGVLACSFYLPRSLDRYMPSVGRGLGSP